MDTTGIVQYIMDGHADDNLTDISAALGARRKQLRETQALVNKVTFGPGTRVRTKNLNPKYLSGLTGTVTQNQAGKSRITVKLDEGQHTGRFSKTVNVPASALEQVL